MYIHTDIHIDRRQTHTHIHTHSHTPTHTHTHTDTHRQISCDFRHILLKLVVKYRFMTENVHSNFFAAYLVLSLMQH